METKVKSDRLRIFASEKGDNYQVLNPYVPPPLPPVPEKPVIQKSTGK
jgi:hypothetical protein